MRAAVLHGYGEPLRIEEVERPSPSGPEVLVRVSGSGVCHSDVHIWRGELHSIIPIDTPFILGHEVSGVVEEVGDQVPPNIYPGMRVLVYSFYCEMEDKYSLQGLYQLCSLRSGAGIYMHMGGWAEYMLVPHYKYLVPAEGLEDLEAASVLADAGVTAMRAVGKARGEVGADEFIVVVGLGGVGLLGIQLARLLTGARVIGVDVRGDKLDLARSLTRLGEGDALIDAGEEDPRRAIYGVTGGRTVRVVLDFVGTRSTLETYMELLSPLGTYILVGLGSDQGPPIPIRRLVTNEWSIKSVLYGSYRELEELVDLARRGLVKYAEIAQKISLEEINEALARLERGEVLGRQVIVFK